jgi:hypothetical protein
VNVLNRHTESESDSLLHLRVQPLAHLNAAVVHLRVQQKKVKMLQKKSGKRKMDGKMDAVWNRTSQKRFTHLI